VSKPAVPSIWFVLGIFVGLGPIIMGPAFLFVFSSLGGKVHGLAHAIQIVTVLPIMWWSLGLVGLPMGSWQLTFAPTIFAAILFWVTSKLLFRPLVERVKNAFTRLLINACIGAAVSPIAFAGISFIFTGSFEAPLPQIEAQWHPPISGNVFSLIIVSTIGLFLGIVIGIICERQMKRQLASDN